MDDSTREALLVEAHRLIRKAARDAVARLRPGEELKLTYPPEDVLSRAQSASLTKLRFSEEALAGLEHLVADACAASIHDLFCLLDGVADPEVTEVDEWLGLELVEPDDDEDDRAMLHDNFFESYWRYKELTG